MRSKQRKAGAPRPGRVKRVHTKRGQLPGTLHYTGERKMQEPEVTVFEFGAEQCSEHAVSAQNAQNDARVAPPPAGKVRWINVEGLHDTALIEQVGKQFKIHPLVLEDILHVDERPKLDDYEDYYYLVAHMVTLDAEHRCVSKEQVSFVLGPNWLLSFQEGKTGDAFNLARENLRKGKGRVRKLGADYLLYALLDAIGDQYFDVLEQLGEWLEDLEDATVENPQATLVQEIYHIKREMVLLRKSVWPLREVINTLGKAESDLIQQGTALFFRDLYDHVIQIMDTVETYRDVLSGMLDIYLSSVSNRMNEIMKVLTIISTIFIPMTFIAGVYGMNFDHMPELHWKHGYAGAWGLMLASAAAMLVYFRRKRWI